ALMDMSGTTDTVATPAASAPASLLGRRFDRLRVKLFLAIAGANAAVAIIAYLLFSLSFDRGFIEYLHRSDVARLDAVVSELAEAYARDGSWEAVAADREGWSDRSRRAFGLPRRGDATPDVTQRDRKSTRLNSSHVKISYAALCLKKKMKTSANEWHLPAGPT